MTNFILFIKLVRSNLPFALSFVFYLGRNTIKLRIDNSWFLQNKDKSTLFHLHYSFPKLRKMVRLIPSNFEGVVIDGGANNGLFSYLIAKRFPKAKIYAFEPYPKMFPILESNLKSPNVSVEKRALSDVTGELYLFTSKESDQIGSVIKENVEFFGSNINSTKVESVTLKKFIKETGIKKIGVIKLDVQGMEYLILNSSQEVLDITEYLILELMFIEESIFDLMILVRKIFPYYRVINKVSYGADIIFSKTMI